MSNKSVSVGAEDYMFIMKENAAGLKKKWSLADLCCLLIISAGGWQLEATLAATSILPTNPQLRCLWSS